MDPPRGIASRRGTLGFGLWNTPYRDQDGLLWTLRPVGAESYHEAVRGVVDESNVPRDRDDTVSIIIARSEPTEAAATER
jgi:hypothetical protein